MDAVSKARPDGYTIGSGASGGLATRHRARRAGLLRPVEGLRADFGRVGPAVHARSAGDFAVQDPREGSRRSSAAIPPPSGTAARSCISPPRCSMMRPGLKITLVTYKGTGPVVTDLLGAHIPLGIIDIPSAEAALASGKIRALAISSARRFEGLPDVPTFQEAGLEGFRGHRLPRRGCAGRRAAR